MLVSDLVFEPARAMVFALWWQGFSMKPYWTSGWCKSLLFGT